MYLCTRLKMNIDNYILDKDVVLPGKGTVFLQKKFARRLLPRGMLYIRKY